MKSMILNKKISALSLLDAMKDREQYYLAAAYQCPMSDEFEGLKERFSYNEFIKNADHNKKIKKKLLKGTNKEIISYICAEIRDIDFCGLDFVLPCEMIEGDSVSGVKYGIYSVILDRKIPELVENYLNNEEYEDDLAAFDSYLEESEYEIPLAILTVIIYLINNEEDFEEIEEELELKLLDYYGQWLYEELNDRLAIIIRELNISRREKEALLNEVKDHKEKNKVLREENNRMVKVKNQFTDILKDINKSIKSASEVYPKALKETIAFKKDVSESNFNSIITNLTLQVSDLKIVNKELKDKNKELEAKLEGVSEKNKELTFQLDRIKNSKKYSVNSEGEDVSSSAENEKEEEVRVLDKSQELSPKRGREVKKAHSNEKGGKVKTAVIGYCEIIDGVHYVVETDGTKSEINNILSGSYEKTYLAPGQFVKVDLNGNILHIYSGYTDKTLFGLDLVEVREFNGEYYFRIDDEEVQVNLREDFYPVDNMIFAVDKDRNIRSLFKYVRFELDFFEESIKAKGHRLYYVVKKAQKGVMGREILTGKETFLPGIYADISEGYIMVLDKNGKLINIISNSRFYTSSIYYREGKEAEVVLHKGKFYFKLKNCGKLISLGETTKAVALGDTVVLDENNNIIKYPEDIKEQKVIKKDKKIPSEEISSSKEGITITHKVLIVGDIGLANSYKLSFLKKGYEAEVVDGFDSFNKISLKLKEVDCIIIISKYISHDNMWRLKDGAIPVIYPSSDGANRVSEEFEEFIKCKVEECS